MIFDILIQLLIECFPVDGFIFVGTNSRGLSKNYTFVGFTPWGRRGFRSRIRPPYPQRVVKGD